MNNNKIIVFLLGIFVIFYFLIVILNLNFKDITNYVGFDKLLKKYSIDNFKVLSNNIAAKYPPLKKEYSLGLNDDVILSNNEFKNIPISNNNDNLDYLKAANEEDNYDANSDAEFTQDQTNISEFIKNNSNILYDNNRHTTDIVNVNNWNIKSAELFNKILNDKISNIEAFNDNINEENI